jgi:hypothetical protein
MSQDKKSEPRVSGNKLEVLRKHPIFSDLEPDAFDQLCRYAKLSNFKRGTTICSKGDVGNSLYAVISGTVKISTSSILSAPAKFLARSHCWTAASERPMPSPIPIANCLSSIVVNSSPSCEASRRWR